jgi:hypothetical protein
MATPYKLKQKDGWFVEHLKTDKQEGTIKEFIEKEGKWFNYIRGNVTDIKTSDFSFQGLGMVETTETGNLTTTTSASSATYSTSAPGTTTGGTTGTTTTTTGGGTSGGTGGGTGGGY